MNKITFSILGSLSLGALVACQTSYKKTAESLAETRTPAATSVTNAAAPLSNSLLSMYMSNPVDLLIPGGPLEPGVNLKSGYRPYVSQIANEVENAFKAIKPALSNATDADLKQAMTGIFSVSSDSKKGQGLSYDPLVVCADNRVPHGLKSSKCSLSDQNTIAAIWGRELFIHKIVDASDQHPALSLLKKYFNSFNVAENGFFYDSYLFRANQATNPGSGYTQLDRGYSIEEGKPIMIKKCGKPLGSSLICSNFYYDLKKVPNTPTETYLLAATLFDLDRNRDPDSLAAEKKINYAIGSVDLMVAQVIDNYVVLFDIGASMFSPNTPERSSSVSKMATWDSNIRKSMLNHHKQYTSDLGAMNLP